jgi:hypothetical protein
MPPYSQDFVRNLLNERQTLTQTIGLLRSGAIGHSLTQDQRATAIDDRLEEVAEMAELIVAFSRHGNFPILCTPIGPVEHSVIRIRLPSVRPDRVSQNPPPRRRKPSERSIVHAQTPDLGQQCGADDDL